MNKSKFDLMLTASPTIIVSSGVLGLMLSENIELPLAFLIGEWLFGFVLNRGLKYGFKNLDPDRLEWKRPVDHPSTGCGSFPKQDYDKAKQTFGMPSGHAQTSAFAAAFFTMIIIDRYRKGKWSLLKSYLTIGVLWTLQFMVGRMRVKIKCHTNEQVVAGTIIGAVVGFAYGHFINNKLSKSK